MTVPHDGQCPYPSEEMAAYLELFIGEATDQVSLLENAVIGLEANADPQLLQEMFRAAHSLKGASRAMGFSGMSSLTHAMEDALDLLRTGRMALSSALAEGLLASIDCLRSAVDEIARKCSTEVDTSAPMSLLRRAVESHGSPAPEPAQSSTSHQLEADSGTEPFRHAVPGPAMLLTLQEARLCGMEVFEVVISLAPDCAMPSVRAIMALQAMEQVSSVLMTTPGADEIENERFDLRFGALLVSDQGEEAVRAAAGSISEIADVIVSPVSYGSEAPTQEAASDTSEGKLNRPPSGTDDQTLPTDTTELSSGRPEPPAATAPRPSVTPSPQTVRVDVGRLDNLLNLVGELIIDQTRLAQLSAGLRANSPAGGLADQLRDASAHLGRISAQMQEEVLKARMLPLDNLFARFPRMVRDLAQKVGKEIEFAVCGRETELDRSVIEVIGDPLIHLLRNCVDHGIESPDERRAAGKPETGRVMISARHQESHIIIEVEDDGRGIDPQRIRRRAATVGLLPEGEAEALTDREALQLIFAPGFSTAESVTEVSGRGVGMDAVRSSLSRFGAVVDVESRVGRGSRFTIKLPLTLAIVRGLLVRVGAEIYVVPLGAVVEALLLRPDSIHRVRDRNVLLWRERTLPLIFLKDCFTFESSMGGGNTFALYEGPQKSEHIVVVHDGETRAGLVVDGLMGEQEIVIKSLGRHLGEVRGISGCTILGDGRIALIIDVPGLLSTAAERKVENYAA